jgi:hypothetical protein
MVRISLVASNFTLFTASCSYCSNTSCSSHFRGPGHHASEAEGVPCGVPHLLPEGRACFWLNREREDEELRDVTASSHP